MDGEQRLLRPVTGGTQYLAPALAVRAFPEKGGHGVVALRDLPRGALLAVWGGRIVDEHALLTMDEGERCYCVQVEEGLFLAPLGRPVEPAELINHSCSPNAGLLGQLVLHAMRDIRAGEEVCYDYAMSDGHEALAFDCCCGTPQCRGRVRADDWQRPDLQRRYAGFFSPYLQRRIDRLRCEALPAAAE